MEQENEDGASVGREQNGASVGREQNGAFVGREQNGASVGREPVQYSAVAMNCDENDVEDEHFIQLKEVNTDLLEENGEDKEDEWAPDGGWGWWCVVGCAVSHFVTSGVERAGGVILLELKEKFETGAATTAWVISLSATFRLLFGPVASILSNKYSCRSVVIVGGLILAIGMVISGFGPSLPFLYCTYGLLCGLGKSFAYTPGLVIVGQYFKKKRGRAVGLATAGGGVGTLLLPPAISRLFAELRYTGAMIILAGISLQLCVAGCLYMPLKKYLAIRRSEIGAVDVATPLGHKTDEEDTTKFSSTPILDHSTEKVNVNLRRLMKFQLCSKTGKKDSPQHTENKKKKLIDCSLLKNPSFAFLCVSIMFLALAFNSVIMFIPSLAHSIGLSSLEGAYVISVAGIFDIIGRILSGVVLDFKLFKKFRMLIYNSALFLLSILTVVLAIITSLEQLMVVAALYGLMIGTYSSQKSVILADILGSKALTSSFGILICFQGLGTLLGPPITGFLMEKLKSHAVGFYVAAAINLLGALILLTGNMFQYIKGRKNNKSEKEVEMENL